MSVNNNVSVCVATSPGLLIKVDASCGGQKATGLHNRAARTSYVRRQKQNQIRKFTGQRLISRRPG